MGIPLSASLANAPTPDPQGLYLSSDIRNSFETDSSWFDSNPSRTLSRRPPTGSAYLGRLGSWDNQFPDRGAQYPGYNGFPSRASSTEEVRMGDFFGYTNTVATASVWSSLPSPTFVPNAFLTSSIKKYEFKAARTSLQGPLYPSIGTHTQVYFLPYINDSNLPVLYTMWASGSSPNNNILPPYSTGSQYSFESTYYATQSIVTNSAAYTITADNGMRAGKSPFYNDYNDCVGVYYYTEGSPAPPLATTYGVPYEVTMSAANIPQLLVHTNKKYPIETSSTLYGNVARGSTSVPNSVPEIIGLPEDMSHSSIVLYTGYTSGLHAKLSTLSGSQADGNSIVAFTGSRFTLTNSSSYNNSSYTSVIYQDGSAMVAHGINPSGTTDATCSISYFKPSYYQFGVTYANFISNPQSYLGLETGSYGQLAQPLLTGSGGYGSKALVEIPRVGGNSINQALLATSRGDNTIDIHVLSNAGSVGAAYWKIEASYENLAYDPFLAQGWADYKTQVSLSYLGVYTNYSASLAFNPTTPSPAFEYYYALSYTRTDGYGSNAIIKIIPPQYISGNFKSTCELYITTPTNKVVRNNQINYKDFGSINNVINIGPTNEILQSTLAQTTAIYPLSPTNNFRQTRTKYFSIPILSWTDGASGSSVMYKRDLSLY